MNTNVMFRLCPTYIAYYNIEIKIIEKNMIHLYIYKRTLLASISEADKSPRKIQYAVNIANALGHKFNRSITTNWTYRSVVLPRLQMCPFNPIRMLLCGSP